MKYLEKINKPAWHNAPLFALGLAMLGWLGCSSASNSEKGTPKSEASESETASTAQPPGAAAEQIDKPVVNEPAARAVLDAMVNAYRTARSYADEGQVRMTGKLDQGPIDEKANLVVAMVRPNKIRLQAYQGIAISDGQKLRAYVAMIPNQVLEVPAPAKVDIGSIFASGILADSMAQGPTREFSWVPLQAVLLMADDPLKTLLHQVTQIRLLPPEKIDERPCDRVEIARPDGKGVFWIDQKTRVLLRFEYPTEELRKTLPGSRAEGLSLVADFRNAQLNRDVDPKAFQFELPPETKTVASLTPPGLALLGKPSPDFFFVGLDNKPVTMKSLAGKVVVLDFWATWCEPCRESMPELEQAYQHFKGNDKVAFLAVNTEPESVPRADLEKRLGEWNVHVPVFRDLQHHSETAFGVPGPPATLLLGPDSVVQALDPGIPPGGSAGLVRQIDKLLAGGNLHDETLQVYEAMQNDYKRIFDEMLKQDLYVSPTAILQLLPQSGIAEKSEPTAMKLAPLWANTDLSAPGNVLVVPGPDAAPRLLVIHGGKAVVELDAGGKIVANHILEIPEREYVTLLRAGVGADGRRYFAGTTPGLQQVHLFDDQWKLLWSFTPDADSNPHAGVGDVQIADLNGDGVLEIAVGYRGRRAALELRTSAGRAGPTGRTGIGRETVARRSGPMAPCGHGRLDPRRLVRRQADRPIQLRHARRRPRRDANQFPPRPRDQHPAGRHRLRGAMARGVEVGRVVTAR
ncbi:MAG: redoxin domain-containing protein [Planctomycetia bacterium]|nr:redoxin domain-containing protein [Planctomycetia bacterium]